MIKAKSSNTRDFSRVPKVDMRRSTFDRSHGLKTTFDSGKLIPIFVDEVLPGDTFNLKMTGFSRLATPIFPVMDNMKMSTFFFAVPIRLIWDNWQRFNGEQDSPGDSTDYIIPQIVSPAGGYENETIHDYMGIPTGVGNLSHSAFWHRAYNLCWNEWFRDQNLQNAVVENTDDGPDPHTDYKLKNRGKAPDYFNTSLPWPQKGDSVDLPLAGNAPVVGIGAGLNMANSENRTVIDTQGNVQTYEQALWFGSEAGASRSMYAEASQKTPNTGPFSPEIYADLSEVTAATINELRQAFQIQRMLEKDARGGSRYTEIIRSHFGVTSPDSRLQRPEYLGGGSSPINITPVQQNAPPTAEASTVPLGTLAGFGTSVLNGHGFNKSFTEHCVIIGLLSVQADLTYQQGLNKMFSRRTRYDFYWPSLANIGEQTVLNREIFAQGNDADNGVFGYQERYAEYRYKPSMVTGKMRSNDPQSLDSWHLALDFDILPRLNAKFIQDRPPISRVVAVTDEPEFIFDGHFSLKCTRPMPLFGVPGLIDHF